MIGRPKLSKEHRCYLILIRQKAWGFGVWKMVYKMTEGTPVDEEVKVWVKNVGASRPDSVTKQGDVLPGRW